jgi:hypothetical protein
VTPARASDGVWATARSLAVDAHAAAVVRALEAAGVPAVILKGPSMIGWLYREDEGRTYSDADVLVPAQRWDAAAAVLEGMGFEPLPPEAGGIHPPHARPWVRRSDKAVIDLHRTLPGVLVAPEELWDALSPRFERLTIMGVEARVPDAPTRALLVALHLAHHLDHSDAAAAKPRADLKAALERLDESTWHAATALATTLHCRERLARGLVAEPPGEDLARRLGLPAGEWLHIGNPGSKAASIERVAATHGLRAKLRILVRGLFPRPAFLRWHSRLARRGPVGLVVAYVLRPFILLTTGIPGLVRWWRLRRR